MKYTKKTIVCDKNIIAIALHNEIYDLDEIIKKRKNAESTETWVLDLEKRRNSLISYLEEINKSIPDTIEIVVSPSVIL